MKELAQLLFPSVTQTVEDLLKQYPPRGVAALRLAPSPTGHLHIGGVGQALACVRLAKYLGGVSYLRIEDTDQKREVAGATEKLVHDLESFGIVFDEYDTPNGSRGNYGPYTQSKRTHLYHTYAKRLVELGRAYPCFCTTEEISAIRESQTGDKTGYYGKWARCANLNIEQIRSNLDSGMAWCLRFNSAPDAGQKIGWNDVIRGDMLLPAEENHFIILKANGIPPYNFAHVVDDTLMRTSHVLRGEEWLISTAEHIQIARVFGKVPYQYGHMPVICVMDGDSKRKLSKRKDKEALAETFINLGYPVEAVTQYLSILYNTDEGFAKITTNNPLFDWDKLNSISREIIAQMTCEQIKTIVQNDAVATLLNIGRDTGRPRKDIDKWSDIPVVYDFIFGKPKVTELTDQEREIYSAFKTIYDPNDDKETWLNKMKQMAGELGHKIQTVTKAISKSVIGREQSPDLYTVLKLVEELHGLPK